MAIVPGRSVALAKLKLCVILLVVLHHSILAYTSFAYFNRRHYLWSTAPIVDPDRWIGFDVVVEFNDIYFMSLMFLISGLFVLPSLSRRGPGAYLASRAMRLGLPFLAAVTVIMPLAYYPSYLRTGATLSFPQYWLGYFSLYGWPGGPAWFIWVLLVFDTLTVAAVWLWPDLPRAAAAVPDWLARRPRTGLTMFLAGVAAAYLSMRFAFGPTHWFAWGPFAVQASRVLLYAAFFATGILIGAAGIGHDLLRRTGPFARGWMTCAGLTVVAFLGLLAVQIASVRHAPFAATPAAHVLTASLFVLVCVLTSIALLGGFIRHLDADRRWLDLLAPCAFGIYVLHYAPLTWMQSALLSATMPAVAKAATVFTVTLMVSWLAVALLRQSPILRRIL